MGDAIRSLLRERGLDAPVRDGRVFAAWTESAGELSRRSIPVRFRSGELTVEVTSSADLHELTCFTGEPLRVAANLALGREEIRRVKFKLKA